MSTLRSTRSIQRLDKARLAIVKYQNAEEGLQQMRASIDLLDIVNNRLIQPDYEKRDPLHPKLKPIKLSPLNEFSIPRANIFPVGTLVPQSSSSSEPQPLPLRTRLLEQSIHKIQNKDERLLAAIASKRAGYDTMLQARDLEREIVSSNSWEHVQNLAVRERQQKQAREEQLTALSVSVAAARALPSNEETALALERILMGVPYYPSGTTAQPTVQSTVHRLVQARDKGKGKIGEKGKKKNKSCNWFKKLFCCF